MSRNFRQFDRETLYLLPPSMDDWLPEEHLARFVVEIVGQLNLNIIKDTYAGRGSKAYHPEMLLALLFYGYATGIFSSRKLERATYDSVAFRYIAANDHPDHDTIATFRKRFLPDLSSLFTQILLMAHEMGVLKLGKVIFDGTKIKANASKHRALSWKHACKIEAQLKAEVEELLRQAEEADRNDIPDGMDIPDELARRKERLVAIAKAKKEIERRAAERYKKE
jgi:transposase